MGWESTLARPFSKFFWQPRFGDELEIFQSTSTNAMASFNPTQIFDDGTTEEKGENARLSAFVGAIAVGDLGRRSLRLISNQQLTQE